MEPLWSRKHRASDDAGGHRLLAGDAARCRSAEAVVRTPQELTPFAVGCGRGGLPSHAVALLHHGLGAPLSASRIRSPSLCPTGFMTCWQPKECNGGNCCVAAKVRSNQQAASRLALSGRLLWWRLGATEEVYAPWVLWIERACSGLYG